VGDRSTVETVVVELLGTPKRPDLFGVLGLLKEKGIVSFGAEDGADGDENVGLFRPTVITFVSFPGVRGKGLGLGDA
jgi:hypothetical protein